MNKLKDLIGSILKENYKNFDKKTNETNADIGALGKDGTTNLIEKIRTELIKLRQFVGYDTIDTVNGETGKYTLKETNYDSVFGYVGNSENGKVKTLLDYIKIFVLDKTDQNNIIKGLQDTVAVINSRLTQLDNDLEKCAKSADLNKYVESTTLGNYNTKDEIKNTYATKTEMANYMANYAEASTVFNLKNNLENNYYNKDTVDSKLATASSGMVKFNPSENTYKLEVSSDKINMSFNTTFKTRLKFVKIDGSFTKHDTIIGSLNIASDSLVQVGYLDGKKLVITEPVWVEIEDAGALGKTINIFPSI